VSERSSPIGEGTRSIQSGAVECPTLALAGRAVQWFADFGLFQP